MNLFSIRAVFLKHPVFTKIILFTTWFPVSPKWHKKQYERTRSLKKKHPKGREFCLSIFEIERKENDLNVLILGPGYGHFQIPTKMQPHGDWWRSVHQVVLAISDLNSKEYRVEKTSMMVLNTRDDACTVSFLGPSLILGSSSIYGLSSLLTALQFWGCLNFQGCHTSNGAISY